MLLDQGARLESKTEHGDTALIGAIQMNSREIIQILLEYGARVDDVGRRRENETKREWSESKLRSTGCSLTYGIWASQK